MKFKKYFLHIMLFTSMLLILNSCSHASEDLFVQGSEGKTNFNNFLAYSTVQYSGDLMVCSQEGIFGNTLQIYDSGTKIGSAKYFYRFQLMQRDLYFIKDGHLYQWHLDEKITKAKVVEEQISDFIVCNAGILYQKTEDDRWYALQNDEVLPVFDTEITEIAVNENYIYVLAAGDLYRMTMDLTNCEKVGEGLAYANQMLVVDDDRVLLRDGAIYLYDIKTKKQADIGIEELLATDQMNFNADGRYVFVSYHATKADGSIVTYVDHPQNGVWKIDVETLEKTKLSDTHYSSLYLFNDQKLLGKRDGTYEWLEVNQQRQGKDRGRLA